MNSWILIKRILTWWMQEANVVATGIGNAMEWFDFGVYAYMRTLERTSSSSRRK